ncbi:hypothetical protein DM02DRAFT_136898 [Periconia macrospinosa]|uniref:DUF4419 domain-containing protein n=1 Tax=Periconia macrospinosa TaxID=97972 RepID=A0A2V1DCU0_9PLEO|nr:hypothetical protein DM02DRAFT_136898 [Periconia macrospinosa]
MNYRSVGSVLFEYILAAASFAHAIFYAHAIFFAYTKLEHSTVNSVTLPIADHAAREWTSSNRVKSVKALFQASSPKDSTNSKWIIQSSFTKSLFAQKHVASSSNGWVWAAFHAYSGHHHLTLRPEDIWFSILSQLSFYINAHAEELRDYFVAHEGQKKLEIKEIGTIRTVDFGLLAKRMTHLIQENVKDPGLRTWIMPNWTTTTDDDVTVASVLMMGTLQKYFTYKISLVCGIPSVTLLGERADWEDILKRLDKLPELGDEPAIFATLLKPVLRHFIASFDPEPSPEVKDFWSKIAHQAGDSGPYYLSGWITAFCFWDEEGKSLYHRYDTDGPQLPVSLQEFEPRQAGCKLDNVLYHRVDTKDIPSGFASVPVVVDFAGKLYETKMVAGSFGIQAKSSGNMLNDDYRDPKKLNKKPGLDSIKPLSGWLMYETK